MDNVSLHFLSNFRHIEYSSNSFLNSSKTSFMISKFLIYIYICNATIEYILPTERFDKPLI